MPTDADAASELERLRIELMDFIVDALSERMASGAAPDLSDKLVTAIDRRVDQRVEESVARAVEARLKATSWPNPDRFADQVAAALQSRLPRDEERPRDRDEDDAPPVSRRAAALSRGARAAPEAKRPNMLQLGLIAVVGLIAVAALVYLGMRWLNPPTDDVPIVQEPQVISQPVDPVNRVMLPDNGVQPIEPGANSQGGR